jgi:hypothetical protein
MTEQPRTRRICEACGFVQTRGEECERCDEPTVLFVEAVALEAAEEALERIREWARGYPITANPDWGEYIQAQHHVEMILDDKKPALDPVEEARNPRVDAGSGEWPREFIEEEK